MTKFWLKMIGTHDRPCRLDYDEQYADSRLPMHKIQPGDKMILYAVGRGKRLFALASVTRRAYDSGNPQWPHRVNISYDIWLPVLKGVVIDNILSERNLLGPIQRGASYFELRPVECAQALDLLREAKGREENGTQLFS